MRVTSFIFIASVFAAGCVLTYLAGLGLPALAKGIPWNLEPKDTLAIGVSFLSLLVAAFAVVYPLARARADRFLAIHEKLIALDIQEGRDILYNRVKTEGDAERLRQEDNDDYAKANRSLALYDVLALHVYKKHISKKLVLAEWGPHLARARKPGLAFVSNRKTRGTPSNWPHFVRLSDEAARMFPGSR